MTVSLSMPLLRQPDHANLPKNMPIKNQGVAVQHWKKAFDDAMAKNSTCENIAPEAKANEYQGMKIPQSQMRDVHTAEETPLGQSTKAMSQPVFTGVMNVNKTQEISLNTQQQNVEKSIMGFSMGQQNDLSGIDAESSVSPEIKAKTSQYIRMTGNSPDSEFPILNLFLFVDQNKAKLWVRDNRIERSQSEAILAKLSQSLRAKNIALSSLVVNGYRIF